MSGLGFVIIMTHLSGLFAHLLPEELDQMSFEVLTSSFLKGSFKFFYPCCFLKIKKMCMYLCMYICTHTSVCVCLYI